MDIERKIYFYKACAKEGKEFNLNICDFLKILQDLSFFDQNIDKQPYLFDGEHYLCGWVDDLHPPAKLRFGRIRRSDLPQVEEAGKLSDLNLRVNAGLAELTHIVFFPNNILGTDFNFHAPRLSKLSKYLQKKAGLPADVSFNPLINPDIFEQLDSFTSISLLDIKTLPTQASLLYQADKDLGSAFLAAGKFSSGHPIEMKISLKLTDKPLKQFISNLKQLIVSLKFQDTPQPSKLQIKGTHQNENKAEVIDLLHTQIIMKKSIHRIDERTRILDKNSAYREIINAYNELKKLIKNSPAIIS